MAKFWCEKVANTIGWKTAEVSGIWIRREGAEVVLLAENPETGEFVELARDFIESNFSHIVAPNGIMPKFETRGPHVD